VPGRGKRLFPDGFRTGLALVAVRPLGDRIMLMRHAVKAA
jgi:hypothetical protein